MGNQPEWLQTHPEELRLVNWGWEMEFLEHHVDRHGIQPVEGKVTVIRQFPQPTTQRKLRQFLGLINFYHR